MSQSEDHQAASVAPTTPGARLRAARIAAGYPSGASAARALGVVTSTYSSHENGQSGLSAELAEKYGRQFCVNASWLLFGTGDQERPVKQPTAAAIPSYAIPDKKLALEAKILGWLCAFAIALGVVDLFLHAYNMGWL